MTNKVEVSNLGLWGHVLTTVLFVGLSSVAEAVTIEETTKPDGTHAVATRIVDIAFGPSKPIIASALILLGALLCGAAVWLAIQDKGSKPGTTSQLSVNVPHKLSAKAFLGFPALLLIVGAVLAVAGVVLSVIESSYGILI